MTEVPATITAELLSARDGPLCRLAARCGCSDVSGPTLSSETLTGGDVIVGVDLAGLRADGRLVQWTVEVYAYGLAAERQYNIKAEIDLDDADGEDWCVVNEQTIVADPAAAVEAIAAAVATIVTYPLEPLLTDGWEPADWIDHTR